jgi:hypothetical protein
MFQISYPFPLSRTFQRIRPSSRPCVTFRGALFFYFLWCGVFSPSPTRATTPYRLPATAYAVYSQLPSTSGGRLFHPQLDDAPCRGYRKYTSCYELYTPCKTKQRESFSWAVYFQVSTSLRTQITAASICPSVGKARHLCAVIWIKGRDNVWGDTLSGQCSVTCEASDRLDAISLQLKQVSSLQQLRNLVNGTKIRF